MQHFLDHLDQVLSHLIKCLEHASHLYVNGQKGCIKQNPII